MFNANDEEMAKREEDRLLKSMAHKKGGALGGATAADIEKKKKEAERKMKEAAASSEAEKKAAEAKRQATHAHAEAEKKKHQEAEAERKRQQEAAHTKNEEGKARVQASVEAARKEREEDDKKHVEELSSITDSAESLKREEDRVRRLMGQTVLDDSSPALQAQREKRAALEKAQKEIEHQNAPAEQQRLVVQREEDRMARNFGAASTEEKQILTPFTGCGVGEGEMGNIATGTINTVVGGTVQAVPQGPPTTMSPFEMEVWSELNKVRMNPKSYAKNLELLEPYFAGFDFNIPGTSLKRPTKEGKRGLQEAVAFLKNQALPGPVMKIDAHFSKSAADLCADHGPRGDVGTKLSDGTEPSIRLLRYGKWQKKCAETISYGAYNARDVVHQWLIDDGNHERPNRNTIFDRELCVVGIASAYHAKFERMVVACLAFDFVEGHDQPTTPFQPTVDKFKHKEFDIADLTESADGQHYVIAAGDLRVPKKQLKLYKQGQLLHLERTITNEDGSNPRHSSFKWEIPYQFNPNEVNAVINSKNEVTITLTKPDLSEGEQSVEMDVLSFSMEGTGSSPKIDVQAEETVDSISVHVVPSTYKENVVVKVLGLNMTFVAKHREIGRDDQGEYEKTVTSKRNITLPFPVSKRRFHITSSDSTGVFVTIDKPHWTGDATAIIDIPLKDA